MVLYYLFVCGFSALRAEKLHTLEMESTALPKADRANCVCPKLILEWLAPIQTSPLPRSYDGEGVWGGKKRHNLVKGSLRPGGLCDGRRLQI
jgi:hypothetical protein